MKKIILSLIMVLSCTISSFAQSHSDRLSLGVGTLYEHGLDATSHGNMKHVTITLGSISSTATSNGTNVLRVAIYVLIHSGKTIAPGESELHTNPV